MRSKKRNIYIHVYIKKASANMAYANRGEVGSRSRLEGLVKKFGRRLATNTN